MANYQVFRNNAGTWTWAILPKKATLKSVPSNGKEPTETLAIQAANNYLKVADMVKASLSHDSLSHVLHTTPTNESIMSISPESVRERASDNSPLYIVDCNYLLNRGWYANKQLSCAPDGTPNNAVQSFFKTLLRLFKEKEIEHIVACFDSGRETSFRRKIYPEYKVNREEKPDDFKRQLEPTKEILKVFNIPTFEVEGFEADDLIGTIARKASPTREVKVLAHDKDLMQIVTERVNLVHPYDDTVTGMDEVRARFGSPAIVADVLALAGDTSDNIPGVPNIGEKKAVPLITQFGSLEETLNRAGEIKGKSGDNIREYAERAKISKQIAIIRTDVPLGDFSLDRCKVSYDPRRVQEVFRRYGLITLLKDVPIQR